MAGSEPELHIKTPLLESIPMSKMAGCSVYIKCDNMQPTASFKIRGIGNRCKKALEAGYTKIISSSGGNAGYAAAYAARQLGMPATVVVPESTSKFMADKIRDLGANVIVHGKVWDYANEHALQLAKQDPSAVVIHPFDHPDVWEGHESVIVEIQDQLHGKKPDVVVTCVGGGGLLCGVVQGLQRVGWKDVPVVAMETFGAESFNAAVKAGKLVTLPDITSMCKCLGALQVNAQCLEYASKYPILSYVVPDQEAINGCLSVAKSLGSLTVTERCLTLNNQHPILSGVVSDQKAIDACLHLLDDHRILVEPACGAALSAVYSDVLGELKAEGKLPKKLGCVVVIVCGGGAINLQQLLKFKEDCNL